MKVKVTLNGTVYKTKKNIMEAKSEKEQAIEWYQIILDQNDEVCTLTCSKDVFEKAERGKDYAFDAEYDDDKKKFKVMDVVEFPERSIPPMKPTGDKKTL